MMLMQKTVRQIRNKKDFIFGSFYVLSGSYWLEIHGRLKKTDHDTLFIRIEWFKSKNTLKSTETGL